MNNLKSILFSLLTITAFTIFLSSCEKEEYAKSSKDLQEQNTFKDLKDTTLSHKESISTLFEVAKKLSKSVQIDDFILPAFEDFCLKSEKNGHSDIEFFYHIDKDVLLKGSSNTLSKIMESTERTLSDETLELCNIPGLAFLLEGNLNSQRYSKRIYVDDGFDDSNPNAHIKYYENGVLDSHPISEVPDAKAIVARISEAYVPKGTYKYNLHKEMSNAIKEIGKTSCGKSITILNRKLEPENPVETNIEDYSANKKMCDRDFTNNKTENIKKFLTTNTHEGWRGKGEFYWLIIYADDVSYQLINGGVQVTGNPLGYINTGQFGSVKSNRWYYPNYSSIIWDLDDDGNRMKYIAYESDGGSTRTINVNLSAEFAPEGAPGSASINTTIPITINNGDDFVGETLVEYCQDIYKYSFDPGFQYNYGAVKMHINNR